MSATYDAEEIATDIISYARARFRDVGRLSGTTVGAPLLQDEEYQGFVTLLGAREGLAQLAETLAASFAQKVQRYAESGGIAVQWPARPDFYLELAASIRTNGVGALEDGGTYGLYGGAPALPDYDTDARLTMIDALP